jgi:carboxymethylenebutenolidase
MSGQWISVAAADGNASRAYLAIPEAGRGPGLVLLDETKAHEIADLYAAEGYVALCPEQLDNDIAATIAALRTRPECTGKVSVLGFGRGGGMAYLSAAEGCVDAAVIYFGEGIAETLDPAPRIACSVVMHFAEKDPAVPPEAVARIKAAFLGRPNVAIHVYPGTMRGFDRRDGPVWDRGAADIAHSRSIALLRKAMGPHYDLETLWEAHTTYEFGTRDVAATMRTMVSDPYVNHVPVMTGGVGVGDLARFYANHFIPKLPKDTHLVPISRTVGADRIVDEMLFCFTHDTEIDFMLPGVPPTGRYVEVPTVAIVKFRGDKLYHEHIYWDQASVLVQIGLLDPKGLPVAGIDTAKKLLDETRPSNTLMKRWPESAPHGGVGTAATDRR